MNEQAINQGVAQNADANRVARIAEAQKYHSPVEEKIRSYEDKVAALDPAAVPEADNSLENAVGADGVLRLTVRPQGAQDTGKSASGSSDSKNNSAGVGGAADANAPAPDATGATPAAEVKMPTLAPRRSIEKDGGVFVVEDREDGPYVVARQPAPFQPIRMYDKGIKVDNEMLMPADEKKIMDKALEMGVSGAKGLADVTTGALRGIGIGEVNLVTNVLRTMVDNPIGEKVLGEDFVKQYSDMSTRFLKEIDKLAKKETKTTAGEVAQTGGEIAGQFVAPTIAGYNKARAMGANPVVASLLSEGAVAIFGINPDDPNMSDLIPEDSKFKPIRDLLGTDPDDSSWANRARNAVETFALLGVGEAAGRGIVKGIEEGQRLAKKIPAQIQNLIDKIVSKKGAQVAIGATATAAAGAAALSPQEAQANSRTEVLQKAISLLNDVNSPAGQSVIKSEDVSKMIDAVKAGEDTAKGIDFNLSRIENGEQLGQQIDQLSEIYKDKIFKGKRGAQTFEMTQAKADMSRAMGFDVEKALSRQPGELWPDYKIKAARDMFVAQAEKTRTLALAIKQPGGNSEDALLVFRREMAVMAALQMQIKGAQTEVARALSQFRMTAKSPLESRVQIRELIDQAGGAQMNEQMVDAFLNAVEQGGPDAAGIFARQANNATTTEMIFEAWINSLLGSPTTHIVNMSGNSLAAVQGVMERYAAAGYGHVERGTLRAIGKEIAPGGITFSEANAYASGLAGSTIDALRAFSKALKTGTQSDIYGKLDYRNSAITAQNINELPIMKSIAGRFGKDELMNANSKLALTVDFLGEYYYRLPGRFLMAEDDLFKTLNYRAELNARVAREADEMRQSGASVEDIEARKLEIMQDPQVNAPDLHLGSIDQMREQTFTQSPGPTAQKLNQFLNEAKIGDFPAGRVVVPFFNVINNIMKYVGSRTPGLALINPKSKTFQDLFSGDPARRQMVMGKWTTGGSIMGTAAYLNMNGVCTGRMTDNPKLRAQMEAQGKKPYSCMVPQLDGSYRAVQYNRLDPVGMTMGIAATTAEVMHYANDDETREMLGIAAVSAVLPYMEEKSYFSGMADFMNALMPQYGNDEGRVAAMSKYFQGVVASAPGAFLGPAAPGTPLSGFVAREIAGDNTRRTANPSPYRIEKDAWGEDVLVPSGTGYRAWEGIVKKIMSRTPGLSDNLPARKNMWGENVVMENGVFSDGALSPLYSSKITYDVGKLRKANVPEKAKAGYFYGLRIGQDMTLQQYAEFVNIVGIDGELERLGAPISMPRKQIAARNGSKTIGLPVDMNDEQYANLLEIQNAISVTNDADPQRRRMNMKQALDWLVKQPEYAKLPDDPDAQGAKGDILRSMSNKYRDAAINLFFSENKDGPALLRRSIELKLKAQNTGAR